MSELIQGMLIISVYRLFSILVGFGVIFCGYKLFLIGVFRNAGEFRAAWGEKHLALKQAAPGTFFALFGAVIISVSLWKGIESERTHSRSPEGTEPVQSSLLSPGTGEESVVVSLAPARAFGPWLKEKLEEIDPARYEILQKLSEGEDLTSSEKEALNRWVEEETIRFTAENNSTTEQVAGIEGEEGKV